MFFYKHFLSSITIFVIIFFVSTGQVLSVWNEPAVVPPNGGAEPLLHSGIAQSKNGSITLGTEGSAALSLEIPTGFMWIGDTPQVETKGLGVQGSLGARFYCASNGSACLTAADLLAAANATGPSSLPSGSVFLFEGSSCPTNWMKLSDIGGLYSSRFPMGVSGADPNIIGVQSTDNPSHVHPVGKVFGGDYNNGPLKVDASNGQTGWARTYPPYLGLVFCAAP